jgi:plastocyanin
MKKNLGQLKTVALNIKIALSKAGLTLGLILFLTLFFGSSTASIAQTIRLLDQSGAPVSNAVVGIALPDDRPVSVTNDVAIMDQIDKQFLPNVLVIQQGQQVSFPNSDNIRHHVYSFSAPKPFEIKLYKGAVTQPILFDQPGVVVLGCNIHDNMVGYIYVAHNETTYLSDEQGEVSLPAGTDEITIWHANLSMQNNQRNTLNIANMSPIPGSNVVPITLTLLNVKDETDTQPQNTSKFKKKFN